MAEQCLMDVILLKKETLEIWKNCRLQFNDDCLKITCMDGTTTTIPWSRFPGQEVEKIEDKPFLIIPLLYDDNTPVRSLRFVFTRRYGLNMDPVVSRLNQMIAESKEKGCSKEIVRQHPSSNHHEPLTVPDWISDSSIQEDRSGELARVLESRRLENTGNSCYLNSTMQALTACYPFSTRCSQLARLMETNRSLFSEERNHPATKNQYSVLKLMVELIEHLIGGSKVKVSRPKLSEFRGEMGKLNKNFENDMQQDAHEYLVTLLGTVDGFFAESRKFEQKMNGETSVSLLNPVDVFTFITETAIVCRNCGETTLTKEPHADLRLSVGSSTTIQELINSYAQWKPMERVCHGCHSKAASISDRISALPQSLIINLIRYEVQGGMVQKTDHDVYPSFQVDASTLGSHKNEQDDDVRNEAFLCADESGEAEDVIVERVGMPKAFRFQPLCSRAKVEDMLTRLDIFCDKNSLRLHLWHREQDDDEDLFVMRTDRPETTIPIAPDGNCFFRAISWCLTGCQDHHKTLRESTAKYLEKNKTLMEKYCDDGDYGKHVEMMTTDGRWATSCEIFAMANLLNVKIYTFLSDGGWVCHNPSKGAPEEGAIFLKNTTQHFEPTTSVTRKTDTENTDIEKQPEIAATCCRKVKNDEQVVLTGSMLYDLVAVICHRGDSPNAGHYVTYIRDLYEVHKWIYCSDNTVRVVEKETVASAVRQTGYIMIYDRQ